MAHPPKHAAAESSDDSDAPEAVSFGSSKKAARGEQAAVQTFRDAQKRKTKEKNRALDANLKARAQGQAARKIEDGGRAAKKPRVEEVVDGSEEDERGEEAGEDDDESGDQDEGGGPSRKDLEARMARAMLDAEEEEDEDLSGDDPERLDEDDGSGLSGEEDAELDDPEEDSEDEELAPAKSNYLPEHLFSALHTKPKNTKIVFSDDTPARPPPSQSKKRKRSKSVKDIVVGSRVIRTLPKPTDLATPAGAKGLARTRKAETFVKKSLNLKGDPAKSKIKGYTRRPANLGVMKRNGPAAGFVRNA
ncbi:uncharacterized protein BXZ73DRAFT_106864 [Epithele typhae]|uniref:uncharacterized protein n=1 Tax=Epithele typhae TaxID=378194 RepID=UPI00200830F2|nr:uncharacterized protein BXZ73DRAFT_106864 [Epithele typhae]KAH9913685.1 hypothetical protein BXZ73DRAFT_106864 [Epithele typhae]